MSPTINTKPWTIRIQVAGYVAAEQIASGAFSALWTALQMRPNCWLQSYLPVLVYRAGKPRDFTNRVLLKTYLQTIRIRKADSFNQPLLLVIDSKCCPEVAMSSHSVSRYAWPAYGTCSLSVCAENVNISAINTWCTVVDFKASRFAALNTAAVRTYFCPQCQRLPRHDAPAYERAE